ncbi:MAG: hypothetical protein QM501_08200, partial [Gimesia sp.]
MLRLTSHILTAGICLAILLTSAQQSRAAVESNTAAEVDSHGGLVLQIGAQDVSRVSAMAKTGRYLVRILEK